MTKLAEAEVPPIDAVFSTRWPSVPSGVMTPVNSRVCGCPGRSSGTGQTTVRPSSRPGAGTSIGSTIPAGSGSRRLKPTAGASPVFSTLRLYRTDDPLPKTPPSRGDTCFCNSITASAVTTLRVASSISGVAGSSLGKALTSPSATTSA